MGGQLYLPQAWSSEAARCAQARVPLAARAYRSKPELAAALVEYLLDQGLVRADWVGGDATHGNSPALRQALQQRGQAYVLDVGPGLQLYRADPMPTAVPTGSGRGRPPRRMRPLGTALALPQVAAQVPTTAWQQASYRPGQQGPLVRQAVLTRPVWRWENGEQVAQALHLLISRELDGTQVKYSLCYCPPAAPALSVARALYRQMQRYWMMALHLLLDTQVRERETIPNLSFASLKLILAQKLQNLLHQDEALLAAVHQRAQANAPKQPRIHAP